MAWSSIGVLVLLATLAQGFLSELEEAEPRSGQCACGWRNKGRIVGGKETGQNEYPFMVGIRKKSSKFVFCGGALVTEWHVLTAAHCTQDFEPQDLQLNLGDHDLKRSDKQRTVVDVAQILDHEDFVRRPLTHDISLLVTAQRVPFSQRVGPACVPTRKMYLVGEFVKVLGWGLTSQYGEGSDILQEVDLPVIPHRQCLQKWKNVKEETMICTHLQGKDSCKGDSGGPLVWLDPRTNRLTLVAVVSYGGKCAQEKPAVNTDITAYLDWIKNKIQATKPGTKTCGNI